MSNIKFFLKLALLVGIVRFASGTDKYCTKAEDVINYIKHSAKIQGVRNVIVGETAHFNCTSKCGSGSHFYVGGTLILNNGGNIILQNNFNLSYKLEESTSNNVHCHHSLIQEDAEQSLKLSIIPYTTGVIYLQCYTGLSSEEDCWPENEQVFVYSKGMVITVSGVNRIEKNSSTETKSADSTCVSNVTSISPTSSFIGSTTATVNITEYITRLGHTETKSADSTQASSITQLIICPTPSFIEDTTTITAVINITEYITVYESHTLESCTSHSDPSNDHTSSSRNLTRSDFLRSFQNNSQEVCMRVYIPIAVGLTTAVLTFGSTIICWVVFKTLKINLGKHKIRRGSNYNAIPSARAGNLQQFTSCINEGEDTTDTVHTNVDAIDGPVATESR